jgi:hypothetical protein
LRREPSGVSCCRRPLRRDGDERNRQRHPFERFADDGSAVRWLGRLLEGDESLTIEEATMAASCLSALGGGSHEEACGMLARACGTILRVV